MNWAAISFDWTQVRAFLATVEEGSFSAASRVLGLTQPTLGRQVALLEESLGVTLFERAGRTLVLTDAGAQLVAHARAMGDAATQLSLVASGQVQTVEGTVRITASDLFAAELLPSVVLRLQEIAPRLSVEVIAANEIKNLLQREADIAIRHVRPDQPDLIARSLGDERAGFFASRRYLERRGRPKTVADLSDHDLIGFGAVAEMIKFLERYDIALTEGNFRVRSENGLVAWNMAQSGLGISVMSEMVAARAVGMERVLADLGPITFPIWLATHRELHTSKRIRLVFDLLADMISERAGLHRRASRRVGGDAPAAEPRIAPPAVP